MTHLLSVKTKVEELLQKGRADKTVSVPLEAHLELCVDSSGIADTLTKHSTSDSSPDAIAQSLLTNLSASFRRIGARYPLFRLPCHDPLHAYRRASVVGVLELSLHRKFVSQPPSSVHLGLSRLKLTFSASPMLVQPIRKPRSTSVSSLRRWKSVRDAGSIRHREKIRFVFDARES
jgi:hypothetical protein